MAECSSSFVSGGDAVADLAVVFEAMAANRVMGYLLELEMVEYSHEKSFEKADSEFAIQ
jgi:hypothetical protein